MLTFRADRRQPAIGIYKAIYFLISFDCILIELAPKTESKRDQRVSNCHIFFWSISHGVPVINVFVIWASFWHPFGLGSILALFSSLWIEFELVLEFFL